jgi:site-specific recombinase XerD
LTEGFLQVFEDYLLARGFSEVTIKNYVRAARRYLVAISSEDPFTRRSVDSYLAGLMRAGQRGKTRQWVFHTIHAFFKAHEQEWPFEKGDAPKVQENEDVPVLDDKLMIRMEIFCAQKARQRGTKQRMWIRNHAMIRLERAVGLRRVEIQGLNIDDYISEQGTRPAYIRVETAKGGKTVMRVIDPQTARILEDWIRILRRHSSREDKKAIFIRGIRGPRLSVRGLNYIFQSIRENAGIDMDGAGFHAMRRGRVTSLHERGMTDSEITKEFGWRNPQTVQKYIRLRKENVEDKLVRVHPMFNEEPETEDVDRE